MKLKVREFAVLPDDVYPARFEAWEEVDTQFGHCLKLSFRVTEGEWQDEVVSGLANIPANGLTPKSKLRGWIEALLGRKLAGYADEIDLDKIVGRPCRLVLAVVAKDDGSQFNKIEAIKPAVRPATVRQAPEPPLDEDGFPF